MGTAWLVAAMAVAVGAFIFGRKRTAPEPPDDDAGAGPVAWGEGLAPSAVDDDTCPAVAEPAPPERVLRRA